MKKLLSMSFFAVSIVLVSAQEKSVKSSQLPKNSQNYIARHFRGATVVKAEKDGIARASYEVLLNNGVKLEFDSAGQIKEIDGKNRLPSSVIPKNILNYINTNYKGQAATDYEVESSKQKVKLTSGTELEFSKTGKFLRIDD